MRGIWKKLASDEGMSLVEVIAAAAILFIVLTGVLSVVTQSTLMNAQAKRMNVANNAVNSYVEYVRSLPFEAVELASVSATGSLEPTSMSIAGYDISIIPSVTISALDTYEKPDLKELTLYVRVTSAGGYDHSFITTALIRNRDQYLVGGRRSSATDAQVSLDVSPTPAAGAVVWGNSVGLGATAAAVGERTLNSAALWVDNLRPVRSWDGSPAAWDIDTPTWALGSFYWDTTYSVSGVKEVEDGLRTVVLRALDSDNIEVYTSRQFIVDNDKPPTPQPAVHTGAGSMMGKLSWPLTYDGTTPAAGYEVQLLNQGLSTLTTDPFASPTATNAWRGAGTYSGSAATLDVAAVNAAFASAEATTGLPPFSRVFARSRALGARHMVPGWGTEWASDWALMAKPFVTRPRLTGSYSVEIKNGALDKITPSLTVTPPSFSTSGAVSYEWHRFEQVSAGTNDVVVGTTTLPEWKPTAATNINTKPTGVGYYVKITCTPTGFMGGTAGSWTSNISMAPNLLTSGTLMEGTW